MTSKLITVPSWDGGATFGADKSSHISGLYYYTGVLRSQGWWFQRDSHRPPLIPCQYSIALLGPLFHRKAVVWRKVPAALSWHLKLLWISSCLFYYWSAAVLQELEIQSLAFPRQHNPLLLIRPLLPEGQRMPSTGLMTPKQPPPVLSQGVAPGAVQHAQVLFEAPVQGRSWYVWTVLCRGKTESIRPVGSECLLTAVICITPAVM